MIRTLKGLHVLNTRPVGMAQELSQQIRDLGGISIPCPALEIQSMDTSWLDTLPNLDQIHQALFISSNAVYYSLSTLKIQNIIWPDRIQTYAIGEGTAKTLKQFDIPIHYIPEIANSEHLLNLPSLQQIQNQKILLVKGVGGRTLIEEALIKRGAQVLALEVYKRVLPQIPQEFINSLWREDLVDIILLTSEQAIENLFKLFKDAPQAWIQEKPCLVISKRLAQSASLLGIKKIILSHPQGIVNTLLDHYQGLIHGSK